MVITSGALGPLGALVVSQYPTLPTLPESYLCCFARRSDEIGSFICVPVPGSLNLSTVSLKANWLGNVQRFPPLQLFDSSWQRQQNPDSKCGIRGLWLNICKVLPERRSTELLQLPSIILTYLSLSSKTSPHGFELTLLTTLSVSLAQNLRQGSIACKRTWRVWVANCA